MRRRVMISAFVAICVSIGALSAGADTQSNRWFYAVSHAGNDVDLTLQLIEEEPPSFDTTFKLTRDGEVLFEHRQFVKEEADEVFGPGCIEDWILTPDLFDDCDDDGTNDCSGICGTAYRYSFVDECVADGTASYALYDETTDDEVGSYFYEFEAVDDSCLDSGGTGDSGCSVAAVPESTSEAGLAALMLMIGLGFVVVARRKKSR